MIKRISLLRRKDGMSREEFLRHWNDHLPMSRSVPGLRRYVICHIVDQPVRPDVPAWDIGELDGIAETWYDSREAAALVGQTPEARRWFAHGASFIGLQKTIVVEEEVVVDGPTRS